LGLEFYWTNFFNGFGIRIGWAKDWGTLKKKKNYRGKFKKQKKLDWAIAPPLTLLKNIT
jgi:hypothetical protein